MTHNFLTDIIQKKKHDIDRFYQEGKDKVFKDKALLMPKSRSFFQSISRPGLSLIAELKKASPSKGLINPYFDPVSLALQFDKGAASCLSVLTEEHYFLGQPNYIERVSRSVSLPLLRKDFIIDPIQVYESKCLKADCMLLIKALLSDELCQELLTLAHDLELDVILEVHNEDELLSCLEMEHVHIIGVNNRNLSTFEVDIATTPRLASYIQSSSKTIRIVAESGYTSVDHLSDLHFLGIDAVLIGEGLVTHPAILDYFNNDQT